MGLNDRVVDCGVDFKLLDGEGNVANCCGAACHRAGELEHSAVAQEHAAGDAAGCNFHESKA